MKWGDVTHKHHLKWAHVSTKEPLVPPSNVGPFVGVIQCPEEGAIPVLKVQKEGFGHDMHSFAAWYDVVLA